MLEHNGMKFSTKDDDNDKDKSNCAVKYTGAFWYNKCHHANLMGQYFGKEEKHETATGIHWRSFKGLDTSLKSARMLVSVKYIDVEE